MQPLPPQAPPESLSTDAAEPTMCGWDGDGQIWVEYTDRVPDEETAIRFGQGLGGSDGWAVAAIEMLGVEFSPMPSPNDPEYGRWYWHLRWPESVAYVGSAFVPAAREPSLNPELISTARRFLAYPGGTVVLVLLFFFRMTSTPGCTLLPSVSFLRAEVDGVATGGSLASLTVITSFADALVAPSSSVTVKGMVTVPLKLAAGVNTRLAA